jgi:hypothetical protein
MFLLLLISNVIYHYGLPDRETRLQVHSSSVIDRVRQALHARERTLGGAHAPVDVDVQKVRRRHGGGEGVGADQSG